MYSFDLLDHLNRYSTSMSGAVCVVSKVRNKQEIGNLRLRLWSPMVSFSYFLCCTFRLIMETFVCVISDSRFSKGSRLWGKVGKNTSAAAALSVSLTLYGSVPHQGFFSYELNDGFPDTNRCINHFPTLSTSCCNSLKVNSWLYF